MNKSRESANLVSRRTGIAVTVSGDPIVLGVGNTESVRITGGGLVGIGTDNPGAKLHIETATAETEIRLTTTGGNVRLRGFNDDLVVNADKHRFVNEDNTSEYVRITSSGVGIGTDNPQYPLVVGSGTDDTLSVDTLSAGSGVVLRSFDDSKTDYEPFGIAAEYINFYIRTAVNSSAERFRISSSGVGIGTDTPSMALDINSTSTTTESVIRNRNDFSAELHLITQNNFSGNADTVIRGYRSRGTGASPSAVQTGDRITRMLGLGWDGSGWSSTFSINNRVEGTVATGSLPSNCVFQLRTQEGTVEDVLSIDSQGSVQVGIATTTAAKTGYTSTKPCFIVGGLTSGGTAAALIRGYGGGDSVLSLQRTNSTSRNGTPSTTVDTNALGALSFEGITTNNTPYPAALIRSFQNDDASGFYVPGDLRFYTTRTNDGVVECARMTHNNSNLRSFLIGYDALSFAEALVVRPNYSGSSANYGIAVACTGTSNQAMRFANSNGVVGSITLSGSSTSFNTSSDYRLKENISTITDGLSRLMQLNPIRFNWISDETNTQIDGFLAHAVSPIVPESVNGQKDEMQTDEEVLILDNKIHSLGITEKHWNDIANDPDRDYNTYPEGIEWRESFTQPRYQGIDQAKLVPLLVAALKELTLKVNTLEAAVGIAST